MNHVDVFTGIGGFALAAQQVWGNDYKNICFCDNNKFCQEVIKKNFGEGSLIYGDIREVTRERIIADTGIQEQRRIPGIKRKENTAIRESGEGIIANPYRGHGKWKKGKICSGRQVPELCIDILTGGFPCQPFSCAGKRGGTEDNRYLWPEMHRVIKDTKPRWIIAENVRGILTIEKGLVFEQVCLDLEIIGYEVQPLIIPAVAIGAPHRRDRVWIIGHFNSRDSGEHREVGKIPQRENTNSIRGGGNDSNTKKERLSAPFTRMQTSKREIKSPDWDTNWLEVATEFCGVDDGLSVGLDGFKLTKAGHRVERLKALGNAIVPQVAMEIMRAIKEIDYEANK